MAKAISAEQFAETVMEVLKDYADVAQETIETEVDAVSREGVKKLKQESPHDSGEYAKGWTRQKSKNGYGYEYTLYNSKWGGRTHVLEKGHAVRPSPKKPGKKTRVEGREHIAPVEEWTQEELVSRIGRKL